MGLRVWLSGPHNSQPALGGHVGRTWVCKVSVFVFLCPRQLMSQAGAPSPRCLVRPVAGPHPWLRMCQGARTLQWCRPLKSGSMFRMPYQHAGSKTARCRDQQARGIGHAMQHRCADGAAGKRQRRASCTTQAARTAAGCQHQAHEVIYRPHTHGKASPHPTRLP